MRQLRAWPRALAGTRGAAGSTKWVCALGSFRVTQSLQYSNFFILCTKRPLLSRVWSLAAGHSVQPLIMEVQGGFHPDMVRYIDGLASAHGARLGADELTAPWSARSFRALHVQSISVALQLAAAEEILDTILLDRSAAAMRGEDTC